MIPMKDIKVKEIGDPHLTKSSSVVVDVTDERGECNSKARPHPRITEVAPCDNEKWKIPIDLFTSQRKRYNLKDGSEQGMSKTSRSYYKAQDDLITSYEEIQLEVDTSTEISNDYLAMTHQVALGAKLSLLGSGTLLIAKVVATVLSGSMSVISSLVDSAVDLTSGVVFWWSGRAMKKYDPYVYPQGRTRLEPVAIIIISVVMTIVPILLIEESVTKIITFGLNLENTPPNFDLPTMVITCSAVVIRFMLFLFCHRIKSPSTQTLAQDHRNDVLLNIVVIICGYIGSQQMREKTAVLGLAFVDPIGAILISLFMAVNWWGTGYEQIKILTGHTAKPEFLSKITWLCINHHRKLKYIDTVRACHFGNNFLVEVGIVLPVEMTFKEVRDVGENLQKKLERFPSVEKAFVRLNYEL